MLGQQSRSPESEFPNGGARGGDGRHLWRNTPSLSLTLALSPRRAPVDTPSDNQQRLLSSALQSTSVSSQPPLGNLSGSLVMFQPPLSASQQHLPGRWWYSQPGTLRSPRLHLAAPGTARPPDHRLAAGGVPETGELLGAGHVGRVRARRRLATPLLLLLLLLPRCAAHHETGPDQRAGVRHGLQLHAVGQIAEIAARGKITMNTTRDHC